MRTVTGQEFESQAKLLPLWELSALLPRLKRLYFCSFILKAYGRF